MSEQIQARHRDKISRLLGTARPPAADALRAGEGDSFDAIVAFNELNDSHGTGLLVQRVVPG